MRKGGPANLGRWTLRRSLPITPVCASNLDRNRQSANTYNVKLCALVVFAAMFSPQLGAQPNQQATDAVKPCTSRLRGEHLPTEADFKAQEASVARPKPPVLTTARDRFYRTAIEDAAARGPNFAGHYVVAQWGCGTGCRGFVVVDVNTGKVYDTRFRDVDYHYPSDPYSDFGWWCYSDTLTYDVNSRLLIIEGCLDGKQCGRNYFVMESEGLRQIKYDLDLLKDGSVAPF